MTSSLDRDKLLLHLRQLEDKYGKRLSDKNFDFENLVTSDPADYQAILDFRKSVKSDGESKRGRKRKINQQKLIALVNLGLSKKDIAKELDCTVSTIARFINGDKFLKEKYHELSDIRKAKASSKVLHRNAMRRERTATKISKIRFQHNMTMEQFAQYINNDLKTTTCSAATVSNWERAVTLPNRERLKAIAKMGKITVKELTGDD